MIKGRGIMQIVYKTKNGIGVLDTPQMLDHSFNDKVEFVFDKDTAILELNNKDTYPIENGKCEIQIKKLQKGTNLVRVIGDGFTIPCQPFVIFALKDRTKCEVATSLDTLTAINALQDKVIELQNRIDEIDKQNVAGIREKIVEIIGAFDNLQERVQALEVGFDPTVMAQ